jgi:uncharacterized membrane protein YuzA (DUF378 family)
MKQTSSIGSAAERSNSTGALSLQDAAWAPLEGAGSEAPVLLAAQRPFPLANHPGWDPYEVWCTRIREIQVKAKVKAAENTNTTDAKMLRLGAYTFRAALRARGRPGAALAWLALVLAGLLGLNRAAVGLFGVDLVADVFGVMMPAARAVYVVLGGAAVYCVIALMALAKRRVRRMDHS